MLRSVFFHIFRKGHEKGENIKVMMFVNDTKLSKPELKNFNNDKCKVMHMGKNLNYTYTMGSKLATSIEKENVESLWRIL